MPLDNPLSTNNTNVPPEPTISPYATASLKSVLGKILPDYALHLLPEVSITAKDRETITIVAPPLVIDFAEHDDAVSKFFWPKRPIWVKAQPLPVEPPVPPVPTPKVDQADILEHLRYVELRLLKMETNMQRLIDEALPEPAPELNFLEAEIEKLRYENSQMKAAIAQANDAIRYWL